MLPGSILRIVAIVALVGQSLLVGREVARGFVCPHPDSGPITAAGWSDMAASSHHGSHTAHRSDTSQSAQVHKGHAPSHEGSERSPCECGADCSLCPPPFAPTVQPLALDFAFDPAPSVAPLDTDHGIVRVRVAYLHPPATAPPHLT